MGSGMHGFSVTCMRMLAGSPTVALLVHTQHHLLLCGVISVVACCHVEVVKHVYYPVVWLYLATENTCAYRIATASLQALNVGIVHKI